MPQNRSVMEPIKCVKYLIQSAFVFQFIAFVNCKSMMGTDVLSTRARDFSDLDTAEAAVPRHPAIRNSDNTDRVTFHLMDPNKELVCTISGGVPTPTIVWMKDNQKNLDTLYFTPTFDPKTGIAKLIISVPSSVTMGMGSGSSQQRRNIAGFLSGTYTCFAANFLGQTQKTFQVQVVT